MSTKKTRPESADTDRAQIATRWNKQRGDNGAEIDGGQAGNEPVYDFHSPDRPGEEISAELLASRAAFRELVEAGTLIWNGKVRRDRKGCLCKVYVHCKFLS
jgi:hypothetical protein